jgi:hypothetical protein
MADKDYKFKAPEVVNGNNRVSTQGRAPSNRDGRGSVRVANIIGANGFLKIPSQGTQFYFRTLTAPILVKETGGVFSTYAQGEGLNVVVENAFDLVELKNPNNFPVVFELFIGFGGFIDNKLIFAWNNVPNVAFPTQPTAGATNINIVDKSGTAIQDVNGNKFYALQRLAIVVSNIDAGNTYLIQKLGSVAPNGPAIAAVFPTTSIRLDVGGDYCMNVGGGAINVIVSEIYAAIPATQ